MQVSWTSLIILVLFICKHIQSFFSGSKKKKRSKKKDQDLSAEVEVKHNDVAVVHEEHKCEEPDEKPPASAGKIICETYPTLQ